ncbi:Choline transporter-like protein 1 [Trachymyrmex cornetzi]|uniref:Choline transporter-like protein n=1 Tax=Trachymyrmex cornetzi TaxID=471704 RepID=A0A195DG32_9HYME|nr:Choline transporter-like protein 1 [Trachymyrmex cornetzi]
MCLETVGLSKGDQTPDNQNSLSDYSEQVFVKDRSCTDFFVIIVLFVLVGGFVLMMTNVMKEGDIYRVINGYDDYGNVCGRVTPDDPEREGKGADYTHKPYLKMDLNITISTYEKEKNNSVTRLSVHVKKRTCERCCAEDEILFLKRCINKTIDNSTRFDPSHFSVSDSVFTDVIIVWRELIYLLLIALTLSVGILVAFRYMIQYIIYVILIGTVLTCNGGTTYLWLAWYQEKESVERCEIYEENSSVEPYFIYATIMSVVSVIVFPVVLVMRKRIKLVIQLFREASKAVYSMPALLFQPLYTYLLIGSTAIAWLYCRLWISSAENDGDNIELIWENEIEIVNSKEDAFFIERWYNQCLFIVVCSFYLGCQHMIVACAVAQWFFTRDKRRLSSPVAKSFGYVIRYHLGTVAFGALIYFIIEILQFYRLILGIIKVIRAMITFIQKFLKRYDNSCVKRILCCCQCCLWCPDRAVKLANKNIYVETAIYGCNFNTAGKKTLQVTNNLREAAIDYVGVFVLFLGKILVVTLTVVSGVYLIQKKKGLNHPWIPITLAGIFAFLVSHCFISIYEVIIDTIFICFCEDCEKNDGINRPYFMSRGLMEFVKNRKKAVRHLEQ